MAALDALTTEELAAAQREYAGRQLPQGNGGGKTNGSGAAKAHNKPRAPAARGPRANGSMRAAASSQADRESEVAAEWGDTVRRTTEVLTSKVLGSQLNKIDAAIANLASEGHTVPRAARRFAEAAVTGGAAGRRAPSA
eukprot:SAG22_NODE_61_length_23387_cov_34.380582_2_plen_139_part_00